MRKLMPFILLAFFIQISLYCAERTTETPEKITKEMFEMKEGKFTPEAERKVEAYKTEQEKRLEKEDADRRKALEEGKITQAESDTLSEKIAQARTEVKDKLAQLTTLREQYLDPKADRTYIQDQAGRINESLKVTQFVLEASIEAAAAGLGVPEESAIKAITDPGYMNKFDKVLTPDDVAFNNFKAERLKTVENLRDVLNKLDTTKPDYARNYTRLEQSIKLINDALARLELARIWYLDAKKNYASAQAKYREPSLPEARLIKDYEDLINMHKTRAEGASGEIDRATLDTKLLVKAITAPPGEPQEPDVIPSIYYDIDFSRDMFKNTSEAIAEFQKYLDERQKFIESLQQAQQELRANGGLEEGSPEDEYIAFTIDQIGKTLQELTTKRQQYISSQDPRLLRDAREIDNTLNTGTDLARDIIEEAGERALEEPARLYETRFNPRIMFKDTPEAKILLDNYMNEHEIRIHTWEEALKKLSNEGKLLPRDEDYRYIADARDTVEKQLQDLAALRKNYLEKPNEETLNKAREINDLIDTTTFLVEDMIKNAQAKIPRAIALDPAVEKINETVEPMQKVIENIQSSLEDIIKLSIQALAEQQGVAPEDVDMSDISAADIKKAAKEQREKYKQQAEAFALAVSLIPADDMVTRMVVQKEQRNLEQKTAIADLIAEGPTMSPEQQAQQLLKGQDFKAPSTPVSGDPTTAPYQEEVQLDLASLTKNPLVRARNHLQYEQENGHVLPLVILGIPPEAPIDPPSIEYLQEAKTKPAVNKTCLGNKAVKSLLSLFRALQITPAQKSAIKTTADALKSYNEKVLRALESMGDPKTGRIDRNKFNDIKNRSTRAADTVLKGNDQAAAIPKTRAIDPAVNLVEKVKDLTVKFGG